MFKIQIAGLIITIENKYEHVSWLCRRYQADTGEEDFRVSAPKQEILAEQKRGIGKFMIPYCESICLYRRIRGRLSAYHAFLMPSAAVELDGKAYVLVAEAGDRQERMAHMRLWIREFKGRAWAINDSRPVFRLLEGTWYACGTPWCGKAGMENPIMAPIKAVCFLEKGTGNRIRRLAREEATERISQELRLAALVDAPGEYIPGVAGRVASDVGCYLLTYQEEKAREAVLLAYQKIQDG